MAKDGSKDKGGGSTTPTPTPTGPFSWQGASTSSTFDPKKLGTTLFGNLDTAFKQGPQAPIASFNPFTAQTKGLIDQGLGQVSANASGPLADFASGKNLGADNPYLNDIIRQTNDATTTGVNSTFNSSGLFGADVHAKGLAEGLANADNNLRYTDYQNGFNNMLGAQGALASNTAQGLGLSGLLDSKNAEQIASNREQQAAADPYNYIMKYVNGLNSGNAQQNTNQPTSLWDILGTGAQLAGSVLPFLL